jgi:hypothetical protein
MSGILVPSLAALEKRENKSACRRKGNNEEFERTESARSKKAGGLCFRSSEEGRLSVDGVEFSKGLFILKDRWSADDFPFQWDE